MKVVWWGNTNGRGRVIGEAVRSGLARHGLELAARAVGHYRGPEGDVAVFYGLWEQLRQIQRDYVAAGRKAVLIDLGYWGRIWDGDKLKGHHRVVVNGLHATDYFQRVPHPPDRFARFGIATRPFGRGGRHILLCGMSAKAAWVYGLEPEEWERQAVAVLRRHTDREIRYRPKQSWKDAQPIAGTVFAPDRQLITPAVLAECWAVVTHHGNTGLDALIHGVPVFCADGLASALARRNLEDIESPLWPDEGARDQLLWDAAYTQWHVKSIADGAMWGYLKDEGLI